MIKEKFDSEHPIRDYLLDKGGDLAVAGITAGTSFLFQGFKAYLISKGINLP